MRTGRKPKCITTIARLRAELGMTAKDFGGFIDRKTYTVRRLDRKPEQGGLALSEGLAREIENRTGVSAAWLLGGKPDAPIVMSDGSTWTKDVFEVYQGLAASASVKHPVFGTVIFKYARRAHPAARRLRAKKVEILWQTERAVAKIEGCLAKALETSEDEYLKAVGRLAGFLRDMETAFGIDMLAEAKHKLMEQHLFNLVAMENKPETALIKFVHENEFYTSFKDRPAAPVKS
jgi:hypothetical protein